MSGGAIATPTVFPDQGVAAGLEIPARLRREPGGGAPVVTLQGDLRNARKLTLILNLYSDSAIPKNVNFLLLLASASAIYPVFLRFLE